MDKAKSFSISKEQVWEAYLAVKKNKGAAGVDGQSIAEFDKDFEDNLYKIWNRMSSGSYFPPPIKQVEIPKGNGGKRKLGIPTVGDRIAQMVAKRHIEPSIDKHFHKDSYGYRPGKSAKEAIKVARERCWKYDWALDLDIKGFFDNIDHELLMKAVTKHVQDKWALLYIERWIKAPIQTNDETIERDKGTPQGGVISPLLANLFLHYAFDKWMERNYPQTPFERYADDIVCHCTSLEQAENLMAEIEKRLLECKLELNREKSKIVYCKDGKRAKEHPNTKFEFLGYEFRARKSFNKRGEFFVNFSPAVSKSSLKKINQAIRAWKIHLRSDKSLEELAEKVNPIIQGWINYYGQFYRSALFSTLKHFDEILAKWARRKYKRLKESKRKSFYWLERVKQNNSKLFAHWKFLSIAMAR
jgi:RNA-directed DNA polymerase